MGSYKWVVPSDGVAILITHMRGLITPLTTTQPETLNPKTLQNPLKGPLGEPRFQADPSETQRVSVLAARWAALPCGLERELPRV